MLHVELFLLLLLSLLLHLLLSLMLKLLLYVVFDIKQYLSLDGVSRTFVPGSISNSKIKLLSLLVKSQRPRAIDTASLLQTFIMVQVL